MTEIHIVWEEFVSRHKSNSIKTWVDINKGHALMKSSVAPSNWRITIKIMTWISTLSIPTAVVLFFFLDWWIPLIVIGIAVLIMNAIRQESAKAVIETSIRNPKFYTHAVISKTMKIYLV